MPRIATIFRCAHYSIKPLNRQPRQGVPRLGPVPSQRYFAHLCRNDGRGGVPAAPHSQPNPTHSPCCAFSEPALAEEGSVAVEQVEQMEQIYRNKYNIYNSLFYNVYYGKIGKQCFTPRWRCISYMKIAPLAPLLHLWSARLVSRSRNRSSTLRSESGNQTYSITANRVTSGLVLE